VVLNELWKNLSGAGGRTQPYTLVLQMKENPFEKIYVIKPLIESGEQVGILKGTLVEKIAPYIRNVRDLAIKLHRIRPANRLFTDAKRLQFNPARIEFMPLAYMRGMNLDNCVVIVDEVENFSRINIRTLLTRMGRRVKCFCLGDNRQIDNEDLNEENNCLNWIVRKLKGQKRYAHFVLKGEHSRGSITDMVLKARL
jgi:PhoH-like ATPase